MVHQAGYRWVHLTGNPAGTLRPMAVPGWDSTGLGCTGLRLYLARAVACLYLARAVPGPAWLLTVWSGLAWLLTVWPGLAPGCLSWSGLVWLGTARDG